MADRHVEQDLVIVLSGVRDELRGTRQQLPLLTGILFLCGGLITIILIMIWMSTA